MLAWIIICLLASVFYYIGNNEYHNKGWLLATVSVVFSLGISCFTPSGFLGLVGINLLLYAGLWIYNAVSGKPPRSQSGF